MGTCLKSNLVWFREAKALRVFITRSAFFLWQRRRKESCHLKVTGAPPGAEGTASPSSTLFRETDLVFGSPNAETTKSSSENIESTYKTALWRWNAYDGRFVSANPE